MSTSSERPPRPFARLAHPSPPPTDDLLVADCRGLPDLGLVFTLRAFMPGRAQFTPRALPHADALLPPHGARLARAAPGLYLSASRSSIAPWISADTRACFSYVGQVPSLRWRTDALTQATVELNRWAGVICALAFFGFAAEARKNYALVFRRSRRAVGLSSPRPVSYRSTSRGRRAKSSGAAASALPISLSRTPIKQRPGLLSPSLADTSTDYDTTDIEKHSDHILPMLSLDSAPPEYVHDIELGAYTHTKRPPSPSPSLSSDGSTPSPSTRARPFVASAFFPARPSPAPRAARPST
ncbi:hypothetical protein FB451DRAFT_1516069 [Mycena latifolia]|nr:hypothetical protein FB451DRAFT_1516069 [Mycena latifolia]